MINGLQFYKHTYNVQSETVIQPGLANMERAMALLNEPHKAFRSIHLAGTNGKGSTLTFLKEMLVGHGLKVGTFMSPGIIDLHDQIQVDGVPVTQEELALVFKQMAEAGLSGLCTDFELLTCAAFVHFRNAGVDVAVVEAGMGGRFDSTNVIDGEVAVIPSIALEHTNFLGETLTEIAWHKAGIIKNGASVCVGLVEPEVLSVLEQEAEAQGAALYYAPKHFGLVNEQAIRIGNEWTFSPVLLSMRGQHQYDNAALAVASFLQFAEKMNVQIDANVVLSALQHAQLPFRFEELLPNVFLDGAHNPASVEKLVQLLRQYSPGNTISIVIGMLADKDVKQVLEMLEQVSDDFYFVEIDNPRAMKARDMVALSAASQKHVITDVANLIKKNRDSNKVFVITGSLYLLSAIRQKLSEMAIGDE